MKILILITLAYLLGSIPFALILAKAHGKDLRSIGSGNLGATNLSRALGRKWGIFCFVLDVLKGLVPMILAGKLLADQPAMSHYLLWLSVGIAAIVGHVFPVYVGFKGGKGVATSFGVALGLWPYFTACAAVALLIWIVVVLIWRYVSLASIIASASFPLSLLAGTILFDTWDLRSMLPLFIIAFAIPLMVVLRHRDNIKRLKNGTESKILSRSAKTVS